MAALNLIVLLILLSWTLSLAFLLMTLLSQRIRGRRLHRLVLRPNCLLTRAPLVFITGPRSFFYFTQYWNLLPRFLREHGYLVEVWRLPWRNRNLQRGKLLRRLRRHAERGGRPVHLFYDASMRQLVAEVRASEGIDLASATETDSLLTLPPPVTAARGADRWIQFGFDLHRRFTLGAAQAASIGLGETRPPWRIESLFLDRGVELAEAELTNS